MNKKARFIQYGGSKIGLPTSEAKNIRSLMRLPTSNYAGYN